MKIKGGYRVNNKPIEIFEEYQKGSEFKASIGSKGIAEQGKINERFFIGDQWYGAKCGNDRPLVRHNIIKRIGNYKISQVLGSPISLNFSADGIPTTAKNGAVNSNDKKYDEINRIMTLFKSYYKTTAERVKLETLNEKLLREAYISGTSVLYTYWDSSVATGLYADSDRKTKIAGDICCEVLDINDIVFGDPYTEDLQNQPYIIIAADKDVESVLREARIYGADIAELKRIEESATDGKITLFTKLYKSYKADGSRSVKCVKVTEKSVIRKEFDTELQLYPLSLFAWDKRNSMIYGESEITYLIPNQIAINRMITANVWSAMTTGMPIMLVNGDTENEKITNDPGQIIKVFGSNEDVAGAVKYISPPSMSDSFEKSINSLIENTLTQSGANEVALGDSRADNATALATMREAALLPLQMIKTRFYGYLEDVARIWADFWVTYYGRRPLKTRNKDGIYYEEFDAEEYRDLIVRVNIEIGNSALYSDRERIELLITMFEKGIIDKKQFLKRLPDGAVIDRTELLNEEAEVETDERI